MRLLGAFGPSRFAFAVGGCEGVPQTRTRRPTVKPYRPPSDANPIREKFATARKELSAALIEREDEVDLVLTALVANEHVLLVGPPGCGKSLLLDSVLSWTGGTKFSILLTKFTSVE